MNSTTLSKTIGNTLIVYLFADIFNKRNITEWSMSFINKI